MNIVIDFPPNIGAIRAYFPLTGFEIFCWGDTVYNPSGIQLPPELLEHEKVHSKQQGNDVQGWWDQYLIDKKFRFEQELEAHQVEFMVYSRRQPSRALRRIYLKKIARRLSSAMYGKMVTFEKAKKLIRKGPSK
jgi:hypothetical protein